MIESSILSTLFSNYLFIRPCISFVTQKKKKTALINIIWAKILREIHDELTDNYSPGMKAWWIINDKYVASSIII